MRMKRATAAVAAGIAAVPAVAVAEPPMAYLHTFGPAGNPATSLGWGLGLISAVVTLVVGILLLVALLRRRVDAKDAVGLAVRSDSGGMSWIYTGVTLTVIVLLGCAIWTMITLAAVAMPAKTALSLSVTGTQWWWAVRYQNDDPSHVFSTANEIHIPIGEPIRVELNSYDVIHSFWIPQLAGKTDVIPGQTNVMWLQADKPGIYRGQCSEYCGAQHAHMAVYVIAESRAAFQAWSANQLRDAATPADEAARAGQEAFTARCGACHAVGGTGAGGILGPNLSHFMTRKTIAAGLLENTPGNLSAWISDSQALKPGSRMPSLALSGPELHSIVGFLQTLQ